MILQDAVADHESMREILLDRSLCIMWNDIYIYIKIKIKDKNSDACSLLIYIRMKLL